MLKLKDKNKKLIAGLINYKDLCIESVLATGDKTLSFSLHKKDKFYNFTEEECYIETKEAEFVIKARDVGIDYTRFDCVLNLEELEANIFDRFESVEQTITASLNLAIVGTGWTVKDNTLKKKRTVRCTNKNALEIVQEIKKTYRVDIVFNTLKKQIEVYEHLGEDKGTYFIDSLNLIALQVQSDSYKFATRIIAEGKDNLTFEDINGGKNYVENFQYSKKIKTIYWKDERYTVKESLLEDAKAKLEELSKPFRSYSASILNLAELNHRYSSILDFKLGDAINLISKKNKIKDKQRIVKTIEWPQDHTKDSVELANATLKFEDIQQENQETTDTVSNITVDNGTVDGSTIDSITTKQIEDFEANVIKVAKLKAILAEIENLHVNKADIQNLNAVIARIGTLEVTKASITELNAIHAIIQQIKAGKADIADLNAAVAKVGILENKTAVLENALAGNLTAENFKANSIVAGSGIIAEGAIGSAQISSLSVNKLEAGEFITSKHKIVSSDGTIEIVGNQILINRNNVNRVILGEYRRADGTTEYGLLVRAKDGQTIMLDGNGVHNAGITDGAIDNNKVADNANISGNKLDINSVIREVNTHGTETIAGTRIQVGDRTLDVELSTQKNTITEHSKELSSQKASLTALDNALKFKVDSQTFTQSTQTINSNITRAKEQAIIGARSIPDTRNSNESPGWYMQHYAFQTISEFKYANVIGVPNGGSWFGTLETTVPWNNSSGGYPTQVFRSNSSPVYQRHGTDLNTWSSWEQLEDTQGSQAKANNALSNAKSYSDSKKQEAIKAAENLALEKSNLAKKYAEDVATAKANLAKTEAIANADGKISAEEKKRIQQAQENLNTAISKADKAKQDAINEANRVAELKKQEAINSANSHADSKANEALNNAKAFVNAEITTVNSHLNKATAEINVLKEKIESKVSQSDIDKSIQEIKIGGRNLALNSSRFELPARNTGTASDNYNYISIDANLLLNSEYTISANVEIVSGSIKEISIYDYPGGKCSRVPIINNRITYTFTKRSNTVNSVLLYAGLAGETRGNSVIFTNVMLEKGNMVSDWTPAPEDTDKLIIDNIKTVTDKISTVESKFTQENNSIKASVQDLNSTTQTITTNVSNINRDLTSKINSNLDAAKSFATDTAIAKANLAKEQAIANADGKITEEERKRIAEAKKNLDTAIARADKAKQDAISVASTDATNKANNALNSAKTYVNAEITTVNNKVHNVESNLNILSNEIKSKVSQSDIEKSISEIKIGGRNLLPLTPRNYVSAHMSIWNWGFANRKISELGLKVGDKITFSIWSKFGNVQTGGRARISFYDIKNNHIKTVANSDMINPNEEGFSFVTVEIPPNTETVWVGLQRGNPVGDGALEFDFLIKMPKLEIGTKATDWTPAPEDTNSLIADSIKVVDTKISDVSSSITQLRDSVTTQINSINSKTHSIETNLNGKASKQEVTDVNNKVTTIKASLDSITQRISSTESKTQTLEHNINDKASKQEIVTLNSKVVDITANLNGITQKVSATETFTKSLNDKLWEATNKLNNVEQRITPTSIINMVSSSYYQKGEANNLFSTKSEVEQLDNRVNYRFSNTGYSNLIFNGNFANGTVHWRNWGNCSLVAENGQLTVRAKQSSNNANIGAVSSTFVLEKGKKYSLTFQGCSSWNIPWLNYIYLLGEDGVNHRLDLRIDINSADLVYRTATFTAPATKWVRLLIGVEGYLQTDISGFKLVDVCLVEGDIPRRFVPNANEISEGATSIDSNGVIVRHTNGSYTSMTLGGFAWKTKNMEKAYHCLAETGWVNISTGAWLGDHYDIKITLPEYFRGKVFTPCSMIQGWYVESNFSLNQLVVNIPYETINYSEGSFVIRVKALTRDGVFQRNINISWLAIA